MNVAEGVFWSAICLIATPLVLYPAFLALLAVFRKEREYPRADSLPSISILIAARNEEEQISITLENLLSLDYPEELVEILVASDASTDRTDERVRAFSGRKVTLVRSEVRKGKSVLVSELALKAQGDVLVLTDADAQFQPQTLQELVRPFSDSRVGCVDGCRLNSLEGETCESIYWKYEQWLKRKGSRLGAVLGATGAVFAVRRKLFKPLSPSRGDDFEIAVMVRVLGSRCVYNERAIAIEPTPEDTSQFRRMVRIVSWMSGSAFILLGRAIRRGRFLLSLQLLVHKIIRWQAGWLTIAATLCLFVLAGSAQYRLILYGFIIFHLLALAGRFLKNGLPSFLLLPYYFWLMNMASLAGTLRFISARSSPTWDSTSS